jgi:D-alanyl-D-alanine carboxypeptidase
MISRKTRGLWLSLVLVAGASSMARSDPVDDFIANKMSTQHIPGLSIAVLKKGKPVKVKGYGLANLELNTPATPETIYKIGSISKQFIAAGIVLLNAEGKVRYDDSITKYLRDAPATWQPITVRHALTHTAGLVREAEGFDPLKIQSDADTIRTAYTTPLAFKPGENHQYSNLGYFVLAEIITRASGKPWPEYLRERIFAPLGMSATRTTRAQALVPQHASAYDYDPAGNTYRRGETWTAVRPSGAFISSVVDLAKWDAALYTDKPFSAEQRELMWAPVKLRDGSYRPYGFGWVLGDVGNHPRVSHGGGLTSFRSDLSRFINDQWTVIVLANGGQAMPESIAFRVAAFYIPDLMPRRTAVKVAAPVLDGYAGEYWSEAANGWHLSRRGDTLAIATMIGKDLFEFGVLRPETQTRFFNEDDTRVTYVFVRGDDGRMHLVVQNEKGQEIQKMARGMRH